MDQRHFDVEMKHLKEKLQGMCSTVETMIMHSIEALSSTGNLPEQIFARDKEVDHMEIEIEEESIMLIARHQPAAGDLRFLIGAIKINNDLERIGDHAVNIAQSALALATHPVVRPLVNIPKMADLAVAMLRDSIDAFLRGDTILARDVCMRDDQVDQLKLQVLSDISASMAAKPEVIGAGLELILVSRNLERVADLATNISEETIYICQAKVIKHWADQPDRPSGTPH